MSQVRAGAGPALGMLETDSGFALVGAKADVGTSSACTDQFGIAWMVNIGAPQT